MMGTYNLVAYCALFGWVFVALFMFARLRAPVAATLAFIGPLILLPASLTVDLPLVPPIDRQVIGGLAALIGYALLVPSAAKAPLRARWPLALLSIQAATAVASVLANRDSLSIGAMYLPGLTVHDALGTIAVRVLAIGVPFYLGMRLIRSPADLAHVLKTIVGAGLVYIPIIVWENRMSPQLHLQLYGVFPHIFSQHIRANGFRPVGFTSHGLELALYMATALVGAAGLARARFRVLNISEWATVFVLLVGVLFCRSLGALVTGVSLLVVVRYCGPRLQATLVTWLMFLVLLYPVSRNYDLFPTEALVGAATSVSADRGQSIEFRFHHEDLLLQKANERLLFGWGVWGRNRVYSLETGRDESVTDGYWILELGTFGIVGFVSIFALLTMPAFLAVRKWRSRAPGPEQVMVMTVAFVVVLRTVDLIPNAFMAPLTLFLSGSLLGLDSPRPEKRAIHK